MKAMITLLVIFVVIAALVSVLWAVCRQERLDELEEDLEAKSLALDERANRIAADEAAVRELNIQLRGELKRLGIINDESPSGDGG